LCVERFFFVAYLKGVRTASTPKLIHSPQAKVAWNRPAYLARSCGLLV
jgi:hypothetical protein